MRSDKHIAKIGVIPSYSSSIDTEENLNYDWVLKELNKDHDIEGIDRIGFTGDGYEIFIVTDDYKLSDIPHFHYRKKEKGRNLSFHTCIQFDKAEYYHHTGNEDILSDTQKENLMIFLQKINNNQVNWEYILSSWNHQNDYRIVIDEHLPMPDYMELQ